MRRKQHLANALTIGFRTGMIALVELPDWIDKPVPDAAIKKHHDAVGKLVVATQEVEAWLAFFAYRLGASATYADAASLRATQLVVKIRQSVDHVPAGDRDDLRSALKRTSAILDFRNAVVHAMPRRFDDGLRRQELELHPPPREHFTIEMLIGAAFAAQAIADYFSSRVGIWLQGPTETSRGSRAMNVRIATDSKTDSGRVY